MAYIDASDIKGELDQLAGTSTYDTQLTEIADDASATVNNLIGLTSDATAAASGTVVIYGDGTTALLLPPHTGTIASGAVTAPTGYSVPTYRYLDGSLVIVDTSGVQLSPFTSGIPWSRSWFTTSLLWAHGVPYTITGSWGYSADDLGLLRRAALRIAVHLWLTRDGEGENVDPAASALTPELREALDVIGQRSRAAAGVW
jgi:hypothetical protein